jgi:general secretion pathway protein F
MRYEVRALKPGVGVVAQAIDADDELAAIGLASAQGLEVLSARRVRGIAGLSTRRAARFELVPFSQELVALLDAGLSLPETLEVLIEKEPRPAARQVVQALLERLREGRSLSQAAEAQPAQFPQLFVATLRAAERSGDLGEALGRYIDHELRLDAVKKRLVSASIYPAALLAVGSLVVLFLLGYVVPRFSAIYAGSGRELPWLSRLLIDWGLLINKHGALLALLGAALLVALVFGARNAAGTLPLLAGRLPAVRERILAYHLARLYRTLGMLARGGTPLVTALGMVAGLLPPALRQGLAGATRQVQEGQLLSDAMQAHALTTPVALRMLRVGENSGDLARMMDRIAGFHDEELARWLEACTKLFEPILMAVIGVVIGAIVILMYLPIFDLAGALQ